MREIILIAGHTFHSKQNLTKRVREILHGSPVNAPIVGRDGRLIASLIERHPNSVQKIGAGIESICVRHPPGFPGSRCFWLKRVDGSETDFSYRECLNQSGHAAKVTAAFRHAIASQAIGFKLAFTSKSETMVCSVSHTRIKTIDAHADHIPPDTFAALVQRFMAERGLTYDRIHLRPPGDVQVVDVFMDPGLEADWQKFHRTHAKFRLISREANLGFPFG